MYRDNGRHVIGGLGVAAVAVAAPRVPAGPVRAASSGLAKSGSLRRQDGRAETSPVSAIGAGAADGPEQERVSEGPAQFARLVLAAAAILPSGRSAGRLLLAQGLRSPAARLDVANDEPRRVAGWRWCSRS
jgi:hypothetical protein